MTDHAKRATTLLAESRTRDLDAATYLIAEAQVHAMLAIAHEQRIANLANMRFVGIGLTETQHRNLTEYVTAATGTRETT